jgi:cobalt-zinc-cadmium efflux system outer membrane protein
MAKAYPNPSASIGTGRQFVRVPGNVTGSVTVLGFEQPIEMPALRKTRVTLAGRLRDSSELALAQTKLSVLAGVRRAFFQVLRRRSEIDISRETLKLVEDLRQRIQVRVDVGEAGRLELIRADAEVATARTLANSAELQLINAIAQLQAAIGSPLEPGSMVEGNLDAAAVLPPLEDIRKEALSRHPLLQLAQAEIRRAEARVPYERALGKPQTSLRSDVDTFPDVPNFRLGIAVTLPFWNKREGQIAEAVALTRQAVALAQARQVELLAALEGAYARYQLTTQQLAAYETGLLREAEEAVRAAETAYQLGERGILETLDAQRVLRTVRLNFLNAQYDRQAALVDLDELRAVDLGGNTP